MKIFLRLMCLNNEHDCVATILMHTYTSISFECGCQGMQALVLGSWYKKKPVTYNTCTLLRSVGIVKIGKLKLFFRGGASISYSNL